MAGCGLPKEMRVLELIKCGGWVEEVRHGGGGGDDGVVARWREREDKKYQVISGKCFCRRTGSAEGKKRTME